jgi:hypothetical protein
LAPPQQLIAKPSALSTPDLLSSDLFGGKAHSATAASTDCIPLDGRTFKARVALGSASPDRGSRIPTRVGGLGFGSAQRVEEPIREHVTMTAMVARRSIRVKGGSSRTDSADISQPGAVLGRAIG